MNLGRIWAQAIRIRNVQNKGEHMGNKRTIVSDQGSGTVTCRGREAVHAASCTAISALCVCSFRDWCVLCVLVFLCIVMDRAFVVIVELSVRRVPGDAVARMIRSRRGS